MTIAIEKMLDSNYLESSERFKQSFNNQAYIFPKDLLLAAQVAKITKDSIFLKYCITNALKYGVNSARISMIPLLSNEIELLNKEFVDSIKGVASKLVNYEVKKVIDSLFVIDQFFRDIDQKLLNNRLVVWRKRIRNKWNVFLDDALVLIDSIANTYNLPSERIIGIETNFYSLHAGNLYSMLYHHENSFKILGESLDFALNKGFIHVRDYAILKDFAIRHLKKKERFFYNVRWCSFENNQNDVDYYNLNRKKIGLISFEYELKMKKAQNLFNFNNSKHIIDYFYYEL